MTTTTQVDWVARLAAAKSEEATHVARLAQIHAEIEKFSAELGRFPIGDKNAATIEKKVAELQAEPARIETRLTHLRRIAIPEAERPVLRDQHDAAITAHDDALQRQGALREQVRALTKRLDDATRELGRTNIEVDKFRYRMQNAAAAIERHREAHPYVYEHEEDK